MNSKLIVKNVFIALFFFFCTNVFAQQTKDSVPECPVKSIPDFFHRKDSVFNVRPLKNNFLLVLPLIASQPAFGFMYGGIGQYTFKEKYDDARYSSATLSAAYTTKHQVLINAKNNLLLNDNKVYLTGDWRFYIFSQDNYGLGSDLIPPPHRDSGFSIDALAEPMKYQYFKFHQTLSFAIKKNLFIGGGVHFDGYSNIDDQTLDVANHQTYHYIYSKKHGFSDKEYYVNGLSFNMIYDSRDDQVNANHGWYGNINYRMNPALGGNQAASSVLYTEYSYYIPLSRTNKQHVLAFWTYGQFLVGGNLPYLNLPAIGWDQSSRGGKGYTQGLIRGQNFAYFETEYRFPISCNQLVSGTVFANFTSASDKDRDIKLFQYVQPAFGVGLRILLDKASRTNLIMNYAWGRHSDGFYLNAGETF